MATVCKTTQGFDYDRSEIRLVFPDGANKLLKTSDDHPFVTKGTIEKHAKDIREGHWRAPRHTVVLFPDGTLAAGHEFLRGIIKAGVPAKLYFDQAAEVHVPPPAQKQQKLMIEKNTEANPDESSTTIREFITPETAKKYLEFNTLNRPVRAAKVNALAQKIKEGRWSVNHEGIAFDCHGVLLDGQHRLLAVVKSGIGISILVTRDLPRSSVASMDSGTNRDVKDIFSSLVLDKKCTKGHSSTAKMMRAGVTSLSHSDKPKEYWIDFILRHYEAIEFAVKHLPKGAGNHAAFRAVVARAYRTQDRNRLAEFCEVLTTGFQKSDRDRAAVLLRNHFLEKRNTFGGIQMRGDLYRRAQAALRAFLEGHNAKVVREVSTEIYPIPEDK